MPEIRNLDEWLNSVLKPDEKIKKLELEYYTAKEIELEKIINQIQELVAKKKDVPWNLIVAFKRCFPFFPSVKNMPLNYFEIRNNKIETLVQEIKDQFVDYKIDYNKYVPKKREKILDSYLGHTEYVDTIYKGHNFGNFLILYIIPPIFEDITKLSIKQKEKIISDIYKHIRAFEIITINKGNESKHRTYTAYIVYKLNLFPNPFNYNEDWSRSEFRKALVDKITYILDKD